jgi:thioredoxin reductase (NADPH)
MDIRTGEIRCGAFPTLTDDQIAFLKRYGEVRKTQAGQLLFGEGDRSYNFIVILEGEAEIVENFGGEARTIAVHGARHGQSVSREGVPVFS